MTQIVELPHVSLDRVTGGEGPTVVRVTPMSDGTYFHLSNGAVSGIPDPGQGNPVTALPWNYFSEPTR